MQIQPPSNPDAVVDTTDEDPLEEIDRLMNKRHDAEKRLAQQGAQLVAERAEFSTEFAKAYDETVRPDMQAVIERLRRNGGGGEIVERPADAVSNHDHRLTLWMSLTGEIDGTPREDQAPYLQLDADVEKRSVTVSEGDTWEVTEEAGGSAIGISRRSALPESLKKSWQFSAGRFDSRSADRGRL